MPRNLPADPRPLTGEPLSIDLLNTRWIDAAGYHDLLDGVGGLAIWLGSTPVRDALGEMNAPADEDTLDKLLQARTALDGLVRTVPAFGDDALRAANAVLDRGRIHRSLRPDGPATEIRVDLPSWGPAWTAVEDFLRLLADRPERVRPCANPECILHFYDVSKNGTRRWCSMAGCGNRAKAMRHYRRTGRG
ncbi:CGNR zinc finger domain-containing protein [Streptosporangium longisporum]|uniref:CGNR zinc finger domain-containing protein n=1 Tax=Streptosporangium longisporum TaxID=46187 RepID=A0ABN3XXS9_9ACTN